MGQPAKYDQQSYQWFEDGTESGAAALAAINTGITLDTTTIAKFRAEVENYGAMDGSVAGQLMYSYDGGAYTEVTESSSYIRSVDSANITDGEATTNRITGSGASTLTFVAGECDDADGTGGVTGAVTLAQDRHTELEYVLQLVDADVADGKVINLQVYHAGSPPTAFDLYTAIGTLTVSKGADTNVPVSVQTAAGSVQAAVTAVVGVIGVITATITLNAPTLEIINAPAAVEATASLLSPIPESLVAPAMLSATAAVQTSTAEARASPGVISATGSILGPSLAISTTIQASAVSATGSAVAPVPEARASPAAVEATGSVQGNITLDLLSTVEVPSSLTGSVQQPTVQTTGDKTVPVSAVTATGSIPGATPEIRHSPAAQGATAAAIAPVAEIVQPASAQTAQAAVQAPTPEVRSDPSAIQVTGSVQQPIVEAGGDKTVPVSAVIATATFVGATPEIRQSPAAIEATGAVQAPTVDIGGGVPYWVFPRSSHTVGTGVR